MHAKKLDNIFSKTKYGSIAKLYEIIDKYLTIGNITKKTRCYFLNQLSFKPCNPLIVAVGHGDSVIEYINSLNPDMLTINDLSDKMISITKQKLVKSKWMGKLEIIIGDISLVKEKLKYDYISLNYLLNIFSPKDRIEFLNKTKYNLTEKGIVQVADFTKPKNYLILPFYYIHWILLCAFFWVFSNTKPNVLGNMEEHFKKAGLRIIKKKSFLGGLYGAFLLQKD